MPVVRACSRHRHWARRALGVSHSFTSTMSVSTVSAISTVGRASSPTWSGSSTSDAPHGAYVPNARSRLLTARRCSGGTGAP